MTAILVIKSSKELDPDLNSHTPVPIVNRKMSNPHWSNDEEMGNCHDEDTLGSCGCIDYHMADCPLRTNRYPMDVVEPNDYYI